MMSSFGGSSDVPPDAIARERVELDLVYCNKLQGRAERREFAKVFGRGLYLGYTI